MISLDSPRWSELEDAYGSAAEIPALLSQLESFPSSDGNNEPWFSLWSALYPQGDILCCALAAIAASKGFHAIAKVALELNKEVAEQFMDWVEQQ